MGTIKHPLVAPFALFMALLALREGIDKFCEGVGPFWLAHPEHWIYPLQAVGCGLLLAVGWRSVRLGRPAAPLLSIGVAIFVLGAWISPQAVFGQPDRAEGFDPSVFGDSPWLYAGSLGFRFLRLVVVVPLLEELFWRGFLMRYLINHDFEKVPIGKFEPKAFALTAIFFALAHSGPDFPAALLTGVLYNWIACKTKNLSDCVLAHAVTNLLLGISIVATRQWGFW
jgi:hypothetical protein